MHQLKINVQVKGTITQEQLASMALTLYGQVNDYLSHLPVKSAPIIWQGDGLLGKYVEIGSDN